ncbi:hypothetical protein BKA70DRAFT_1439056 [Coprinopsis sp. MPI-PUGE-AT-0042]|nr:hypothetical protein BKA70DRAFT_1439056 [Coprinopsis sp. MPI-PUGE-AT-0042]
MSNSRKRNSAHLPLPVLKSKGPTKFGLPGKTSQGTDNVLKGVEKSSKSATRFQSAAFQADSGSLDLGKPCEDGELSGIQEASLTKDKEIISNDEPSHGDPGLIHSLDDDATTLHPEDVYIGGTLPMDGLSVSDVHIREHIRLLRWAHGDLVSQRHTFNRLKTLLTRDLEAIDRALSARADKDKVMEATCRDSP